MSRIQQTQQYVPINGFLNKGIPKMIESSFKVVCVKRNGQKSS